MRLRAIYDDVARADHPALASPSDGDGSYRRAPPRGSLRAPRPLAIALDHETPADARAVLGPEVRAAVLSLFALGFLRVTIDDAIIPERPGVVEAHLWTFALSAVRAASTRLRASSIISPRSCHRAESTAQCTDGFSLRPECTADCTSRSSIAFLVATVVGAIASFIARPALLRRFGERSGSFAPIFVARVKVFAGCAVLAYFLLFSALLFIARHV